MARLTRAENELIELIREGKKFRKELNFLMIYNAGQIVQLAVRWVRHARQSIEYKRKRALQEAEEQAFMIQD